MKSFSIGIVSLILNSIQAKKGSIKCEDSNTLSKHQQTFSQTEDPLTALQVEVGLAIFTWKWRSLFIVSLCYRFFHRFGEGRLLYILHRCRDSSWLCYSFIISTSKTKLGKHKTIFKDKTAILLKAPRHFRIKQQTILGTQKGQATCSEFLLEKEHWLHKLSRITLPVGSRLRTEENAQNAKDCSPASILTS